MKPYLAIFRARFQILFQYRAAALAGLGTQVFWGIIKVMILQAFYAQSTSPQPMTLAQAMTFLWLGQGLLMLLPWNIDKEIEAQIRSGDVAYELVRPVDLYWSWFNKAMAMRIVPTLLRAIPMFFIAGFFFNLGLPVSLEVVPGFLASVVLACLVSAAITSTVIISMFWTISGEGIVRMLPHTVILLSGMVVPLPLFPDWMQPFLNIQPFRCILDIPSRIYTGLIPMEETLFYLCFQGLWLAFFIIAGKLLIQRAIKKFVIQGG